MGTESDDFLDSTQEVTVSTDQESLLRRARPTGKAMLIVLAGAHVGHRAVLDEEEFVIGRGTSAGLQLEGDSISRIHAKIEWRDDNHFLIDCGSTNGSFVNYRKVARQRLCDDDEIQIGQVLLKYLSGDNIETAYHEQFRRLVRQDALTGALNRPTFDEEFRVALRRADRTPPSITLILFDLDHFKLINDSFGHTAGDLVLREVGAAVGKLVAPPHQFARIGGEEFAVIFAGSQDDATKTAEHLRTLVAGLRVTYETKQILLTTSIGVAEAKPGDTPSAVYEAADRKLYRAKEAGRNRIVA